MLDRLKNYLASLKITPLSWLVGVSGVLMVRFFVESLSSPTSSGYFASDASTLIHYYLFFMAALLLLMLLVYFFLPDWRPLSPQFALLASLGIFIAPVIDWIASGGEGSQMLYLFAPAGDLMRAFVSFLFVGASSITTGLKIEILLGLLIFSGLVWKTQKSWKRALVFFLVTYVAVFILGSLPSMVALIGQQGVLSENPLAYLIKIITESSTLSNNLHSSLQYGSTVRLAEIAFNFMIGKILFLIVAGLSSFWFYLNFKEKFKTVLSNARPERIFSYILFFLFGIFFAYKMFGPQNFNWNDWLSVIVFACAIWFSGLFAIGVNDLADEDTDRISNANRPLISGTLDRHEIKQILPLFLVLALLAAFLAGYTAFFFILASNAIYWVYSAPPLRLKKLPLLPSFLIGLCFLTVVAAGFFLFAPIKQTQILPDRLILGVVAIFALLANVRDMKDVAGDRVSGIKTLPVLFGEIWGPRVVGFCAAIAFLLLPIISGFYWFFLTAVPAALLVYYFVNKKPYSEKPIDVVCFLFMFLSFLMWV